MKKIVTICIILFVARSLPAQSPFFVSGGISLFAAVDQTNDQALVFPAITFLPGRRLKLAKDVSLLIGVPVSLGASVKDDHLALAFDFQGTANLAIGYSYGNESKKNFGVLFGLGSGYHNSYREADYPDGTSDRDHIECIGPVCQAGVMLPMNKSNHKDGVLIRGSWMSDYIDHHKHVISVGLIFW